MWTLIKVVFWGVAISLILGFGFVIYQGLKYLFVGRKKEEKIKMLKEERRRKSKIDFEKHKSELIEKFGQPDKIIDLNTPDEYIKDRLITIFAKSSTICIGRRELLLQDIVSFKVVDNYQIIHGDMEGEFKTSTNTGSLVGRSVLGATLGGPTGAIIGASSASKTTNAKCLQENDMLIHDYTLFIGIRSFEKPMIEIHIGDRYRLASETEIIFNNILLNNKIF